MTTSRESSGVFRVVVALLGLAVFAALFAGIAQGSGTERRSLQAFQLAPGQARSDQVQPGGSRGNITVDVEVLEGTIDLYVIESALSNALVQGDLRLDQPFTYRSDSSRINVTGNISLVLPADMSYDIVLDNSDAYYDNDAVPAGVAVVDLTIRYPVEERGSIVLGVLATIPSLLLVGFTLARAIRRHRRSRTD